MKIPFLFLSLGFLLLGAIRSLGADPSDTTYVRFNTNLGYIDVQMLTHEAPNTVANFQSYTSAYANSFFHRSVPGFVIQGGGYVVDSGGAVYSINPNTPIVSEAGVPNTRGTLAMALSTGPNSATNEWFFNLADNSSFLDDTSDGGPFTVFGIVANTNSLSVMDQIASVPVFNFGTYFESIPLLNYTTDDYNNNVSPAESNFVIIYSITPLAVQNFSAWQTVKFTAIQQQNPGIIAPTATPFNDGATNLEKYLCDINPSAPMTAADRAKLPVFGQTTISGTTYMTLSYQQSSTMVGVTVLVQTSPDLQTWTTVSQSSIFQTGANSSTGDPLLEVLIPTSGTRLFIRLKITQSS